MKNTLIRLSIHSAFLALLTLPCTAQRANEAGGEVRGGMRVSPLMQALDTDKDGSLSEDELKNATAALKALDKNGDGKITGEELRPAGRGEVPRGEGSRAGGGGGGDAMVARLMEMDKNGDGKLTKDELPERMAGMLARGDTDKDGALSKEEIAKLTASSGTAAEKTPTGGTSGAERSQKKEKEEEEDDDDDDEKEHSTKGKTARPKSEK